MQLFTDNYGPSKIDVQKAKVRFTLFTVIRFFENPAKPQSDGQTQCATNSHRSEVIMFLMNLRRFKQVIKAYSFEAGFT
jgi:hypothetical protein